MGYVSNVMDIRRQIVPTARQLEARYNVKVVISGPRGQKYTLPTWVLPGPRILSTVVKEFGYRTETIQAALQKTESLIKKGIIKPGSTIDLADVILGRYDQVTVNVGAYCGQEGKGKIADWLAQDHVDMVVRHQGGDNCCYETSFNGTDIVLSLLPVGVLSPKVTAVLGNATYINPDILLHEISVVEGALKQSLVGRLIVSGRAHITLPYHVVARTYEETARDLNAQGGCNTGSGLTAADKYGRRGITINDLFKPEELRRKLEEHVPRWNDEIHGLVHRAAEKGFKLPSVRFTVDELFERYSALAPALQPYVKGGVTSLVDDALSEGKRILFQGVQAALVDIDHGGYPNCTSSNTLVGAVSTAAGIDPQLITNGIGTVKLYATRSHAGAFPTQIAADSPDAYDAHAYQHILEKGKEYDHVFGEGGKGGLNLPFDEKSPNRIGWIDTVFLKYSVRRGLTQIAVTKLDVLSGLPTIKICIGYAYRGEVSDYMPENPKILKNVSPVYEELPGWEGDISKARSFEELPVNAQNYLKRIAQLLNVRIGIVSVGPQREQTFWVPPYHFDSLIK